MRLPSLKTIFQLIAQKDDKPVLISEGRFLTMLGDKTETVPVKTSADNGREGHMSIVVDRDAGVLSSQITINMKHMQGSEAYVSSLRAERSSSKEGYYEIKEIALDNKKLDPKKPGLVDLAMSRMMWYERHLSTFGRAQNWGVPIPHSLSDAKGFKHDLCTHASHFWKVSEYLSKLNRRSALG